MYSLSLSFCLCLFPILNLSLSLSFSLLLSSCPRFHSLSLYSTHDAHQDRQTAHQDKHDAHIKASPGVGWTDIPFIAATHCSNTLLQHTADVPFINRYPFHICRCTADIPFMAATHCSNTPQISLSSHPTFPLSCSPLALAFTLALALQETRLTSRLHCQRRASHLSLSSHPTFSLLPPHPHQ